MATAVDIVKVIQMMHPTDPSMRYLVSLANFAFKRGYLTECQEQVFQAIVDRLLAEGADNAV